MTIAFIFIGVFLVLTLAFIASSLKIVSQTQVYVIERLGTYNRVMTNGVKWIIPIVERVALKENVKEKVMDFPAQDVITRDNVTMKVDTVVYMQITDPKLYAYGVERPMSAVENMTATTLRNLIGDMALDQTLTSRDNINEKLRSILDEATDAWGIKVIRVELKNIIPPADVSRAMEKQMRAEREKREKILIAEGTKEAAILEAEGTSRASILLAEGKKRSLELINEAQPTPEVIKLKALEALVQAADGQATTIILPSDVADVASIASTFEATRKAVKENK